MGKCAANVTARLKKRVTVQTVSRLPDGQGGFTETWVDRATVWAAVEPYSGYQRFQAMQMQTPVTHKIEMRYRADVTTGTRLKYGDRYFSVEEALNVLEDGRFLAIKAVERVVIEPETDIGALLLDSGAYLSLLSGGRLLLEA